MLTKKSLRLFYLLKEESSLKIISDKMNLTERAVRYEKENLLFYLTKFGLLSQSEVKNFPDSVKKISNSEFLKSLNPDSYSFSKEEREEYVLASYLFGGNSKQKFLQDTLNSSMATIASDVQKIKRKVNSLGLEIERDPKKGNYVAGNERKIRQVMLNFLLDYLFVENMYYTDILIKGIIAGYFKDMDLKSIERLLNKIQEDLEKTISDEAYKILKIYLMILTKRVGGKNFLNEIKNKNMIENSQEYKVVSKRFPVFCSEMNIYFSYEEKYLLSEYILGSHSYNLSYSYYENWFQLEILVNKLIIAINSLIDVNILGDRILVEGLLNHLRPAMYRIRQGIKLENSIYEEVYENDLYLFKIVSSELDNLKEYLEVDINQDETAFLTIHFREAINRCGKNKIMNILIVCGFGYGSSKLLRESIGNYFDVNIVEIMPLHKFYQIRNFSDIDLVVTTVDIEAGKLRAEKIDTKSVKVNTILSEDDFRLLEEAGLVREKKRIDIDEFLGFIEDFASIENRTLLKGKIMEKYPQKFMELKEGSDFLDLLKLENIYTDKEFLRWQDSISFLGEILIEEGIVKKGYVDSIIEILEKDSSYMVLNDNILLAHGKRDGNVLKTSMYLMTLKNGLMFPNQKNIEYIILFSSRDGQEHTNALLKLTELIVEEKLFQKIEKDFRREKIYETIKKIIKNKN